MYKKNAANNRDALFGGAAGASDNKSRPKSSSSSTSRPSSSTTATATTNTSKGYTRKAPTKNVVPKLSGEARAAKLKEAEEYKNKANKCMETGFFKKADPVAACTYFKRAADAYKAVGGEDRLERLYRIESGNCNMICGAWASAASDFTRAAELLENEVEQNEQIRRDTWQLYKKASDAWLQLNEPAKAAASKVSAALALRVDGSTDAISKEVLAGLEEAVEAHVPDPLNPYARYRQTGHSAFIDENSEETVENCSAATKEFAKQHLVSKSYAHEPLQQVIYMLVSGQEFASALYAAGAVTAVLSADGMSTLTLSRAFIVETILTLAMGDPILAEQTFLNRHVQYDFYLKSRECQLAEELTRAIKNRDIEALDEARSKTGPNRAALSNLAHDSLREVVQNLRISGVARSQQKVVEQKEVKPLNELLNQKTGYEAEAAEGAKYDTAALDAELDNLDLSGDDDDDGGLGGGDELDALEDDDIDLR